MITNKLTSELALKERITKQIHYLKNGLQQGIWLVNNFIAQLKKSIVLSSIRQQTLKLLVKAALFLLIILGPNISPAQSIEDYEAPAKASLRDKFASYFSRGEFNITTGAEFIFLVSTYTKPEHYSVNSTWGVSGSLIFGYIGLGGTYLSIDLNDRIDGRINLRNSFGFFDIYGRLPLPPFIELLAGVGIGTSFLECKNAYCRNTYPKIQTDKQGLAAVQIFVKLGIWAGKIYRINVSYRHVISNLKSIKNNNLNSSQKLPGSLYAIGAGLTIIF